VILLEITEEINSFRDINPNNYTLSSITTRTSPDGKAHNQIDRILIDRRRHSSILDVRSFRAADCDTEHYLVVAKLRGRLAVRMETFNAKKLNGVEGKKKVLKSQIGSQLSKI
jgi:hypothetical protein